ncbi:Hypothetical predicted protein [Pelobates cultripes]|uniref:Uncharacterized protein n=1 Tax=Pelobates cultripes TaxID=61616 RepID=A0AAD1RH60_PELCU|nr:Hypothetical predicted protein [Pelobates cultripes]
MADAEQAPDKMEDNPDILASLDRIFDNFWRKLEGKQHQPVWSQSSDHSLHKPTLVMLQKTAATTPHQALTWRRGGKRG